MALREYRIQLKDAATGETIMTTGGKCQVCQAGSPKKVTLYDKSGAQIANPVSLTRGMISFFTQDSVDKVDLFILAPGGQFVVRTNVVASGPNEIVVDTQQRHQIMIIPFAQADFPANTETDTGFDEPANALFQADSGAVGVRVTAIDATETIDVGTATAESGDPDGFVSAASLGSTGVVLDKGALLVTLVGYVSSGKSIVITTSPGSDTGEGYVQLPYLLLF
jgi:hypothetical protein